MKKRFRTLLTLSLGLWLAVGAAGCKSMNLQKARARSEQLQPQMSLEEVYKLLGKPREDFAGSYVWEYYWAGEGSERMLRVVFEAEGGQWVVRDWRWE